MAETSKLMSAMRKRVPAVTDRMGAQVMSRSQTAGVAGRQRDGALHAAGRDGAVRGGSPHHVMRSAYTRASINPALTGILLAGATAAAAALLGRADRR
ncbi:hypothetical protein OMR07_12510 [Methylobacterium organophilum]|nr:hypothetical protein [Methylobacterium organophilum]